MDLNFMPILLGLGSKADVFLVMYSVFSLLWSKQTMAMHQVCIKDASCDKTSNTVWYVTQ